uniref:Teneurin-like YD-shell domain-containing protein n=1 Tax=Prevotella sp. GTC17253 TaxID=3236793 RepID=A0AB33ISM1_9BACT
MATTLKTDYCGNMIYEDGKLSKILTDEGYISFKGNAPVYHYYLRDHLGSIRVVIDDNGSVEQVNHYYPFGGLFGESTGGGTQPYKYNGKELDRMHGLDWYDYGARHSDAVLGRWMCMDPLAEKYYDVTPYGYCGNDPVNRFDPDGMDWVEDNNGNVTWRADVNTRNHGSAIKKGETYRGRYYERVKNWNNSKYQGMVLETYHTYSKMSYSPAKDVYVDVGGKMRNYKIGDVSIKLIATFKNGKTRVLGLYNAVAGGFGNGAPENGNYTISTYQDRSPKGWYNKGMNRDGVGFSYNLNPLFDTGRTDLRIHPDGNNEGTLGCIGLLGNAKKLIDFKDTLNRMLKVNKTIFTNIHIYNNPNNNGKNGTKIPNVNE